MPEAFHSRAPFAMTPLPEVTQLSLGYALSIVGKRPEACAAFEQCVRLATEAQRQLEALAA